MRRFVRRILFSPLFMLKPADFRRAFVLFLSVNVVCSTIAVAILPEQVLNVLCILPYPLLIAVVAVDEHDEMAGAV